MKPKIDMITVPVKSLEVSNKFYRDLIRVSEDQISSGDNHTAFLLDGGMSLVLFEHVAFAQMTDQKEDLIFSSLILTHTAESEAEVCEILQMAEQAGGIIIKKAIRDEWSFKGCFKDPDGHIWEILAWNNNQPI
ncbi:VOC family protein [Cytobacillus purgationiresistens]|uniref:Lactoylglutathione lyase n=1 Tax=Cytobacillus purgationiresistens TaxID=863449 RepID=A0ABU0ARB8_9BACI|nr:VOC family protein [Cytobacillus purgationiresistens]MDQ0273823.1 putative lactoylglutathione lyase [Cytobacillus purgationiresistens]